MTSLLGPNGWFWPCNEDLDWCWFSSGILCLYVVACDNAYSSLIIMLMLLGYYLTTRIKSMVWLGYARWCFYVESNCGVHVQVLPTP